MLTATSRTEVRPDSPLTHEDRSDGPPALAVRASYHGILIGTRFLADAAPAKRFRHAKGLDPQTNYVIGQSAGVDAPAASALLGGIDFPLVSRWSAGFLINVTPQMTGDVAVGGKVYPLADYLAGRGCNFTLPPNARARIDCGAMTFRLDHTTRAEPLPKRWLNLRWDEHKFTLGSFLGLGLFLLMIFAVPPEGMSLSSDLLSTSRPFVPFTIKAPEPDKVPEFLTKKTDTDRGDSAKAHTGQPGKMGDETSKRASGVYTIKGNEKKMQLGQAESKAAILNTGILGVLRSTQGSRFASIFASGSAVGSAQSDVLANLVGSEIAGAYGMGGLGTTGSGNGGGGTGLLTVGTADFNTSLGRNYGRGPGIGGLPIRQQVKIAGVTTGIVTTRGSLDKEIIRRVVRLHMNEVKYCYDKELVRKASLEGRVSVQFLIAATGQVINSFLQSSTMGNLNVEKCVIDAVKRWEFPKPTGGGIVIVTYPFNFVAGSGS